MKDNLFKQLVHAAKGYEILLSGKQLSKGYKPDCVLLGNDGYIIMECDTGTSRKGYLGAMMKAARFLSKTNTGVLVLVIKEKPNTTVRQIADHLRDYLSWLKPLTNLRQVYLIETTKYCQEKIPLRILSSEFIENAILINAGV